MLYLQYGGEGWSIFDRSFYKQSGRRCIMPEESKISKAQQKAVHKYVKNNYDRLELTVPKGQKDIIKAAAENAGESLNTYVRNAINQRMERDASNPQFWYWPDRMQSLEHSFCLCYALFGQFSKFAHA